MSIRAPTRCLIRVGGSFGGTGNILVAIIASVQLSATIVETLTFAITGLPGLHPNAGDKMAGCVHVGPPTNDGEDGITINGLVTTTAATVPFGTLVGGNFYEGCQRLEINTNAGSGYTITTREDHPLQTLGGFCYRRHNMQWSPLHTHNRFDFQRKHHRARHRLRGLCDIRFVQHCKSKLDHWNKMDSDIR